jgi:Kef-type K+ transport system membrane component KefB
MLAGLVIKGKGGTITAKAGGGRLWFLIPIFFVVTGTTFEVSGLWSAHLAPIQVALLLGSLVLVRGVPVFLYKKERIPEEKMPFAFNSATGLSLIDLIQAQSLPDGLSA